MAEFAITTRIRKDKEGNYIVPKNGFISIYITIAHNGVTRFLKTGLKTSFSSMKKTYNRLGNVIYEVADFFVIKEAMAIVEDYMNRCNRTDISGMTCPELIEFLSRKDESPSFVQFANQFIGDMYNREQPSVKNYKTSLNNFLSFINRKDITFEQITSKTIAAWITSLSHTRKAKNMYPSHIKTLFNAGVDFYNDYDRGILLIKNDPFRRVKIPRPSVPDKRNIGKEELLDFYNFVPIENTFQGNILRQSLESLAKEVGLLIFYLVGINSADLYHLEKSNYKKGKLCYKRRKTKTVRDDGAYIEIAVPEEALWIFEKHKGKKKLFDFADRYSNHNVFSVSLNIGLSKVAKKIGLDNLTTYTFRHTWATIAQNHCDATIADVAFALNHSSEHKITERYISIDYSPIDKLNRKVIDYVFNKNKKGSD